ncbi:mitochondrial carrier [Neoconidiobolus thromboides FSU 785]|nr:mitochondrial carrier [Neoconidiobolus thromboides FSU 785]
MSNSKTTTVTNKESSDLKHTIQGYCAGIASGTTKMLVGHPFDTIKVRLQTENLNGRFQGPMDCLKLTIKKEGILALYKGSTPPLVGWAIIDSMQAGTYTATKRWLSKNVKGLENKGYLMDAYAGIVGGWTSSLISTPVEQIKARLQIQYDNKNKQFKGPIDCSKQLIAKYGVFGLWKGFFSTLLFRSYFALFWPTYQFTSDKLKNEHTDFKVLIPFISGGVAATTFWCFAFPADVVKNRMMSQNINTTKPLYPTVLSCFKYVYNTQGLKGFYRGFLPALLRSFPTNGAALMAYELVLSF